MSLNHGRQQYYVVSCLDFFVKPLGADVTQLCAPVVSSRFLFCFVFEDSRPLTLLNYARQRYFRARCLDLFVHPLVADVSQLCAPAVLWRFWS